MLVLFPNKDWNSIVSEFLSLSIRTDFESENQFFSEIAKLGREATELHSCLLTVLDIYGQRISYIYCSSENASYRDYISVRKPALNSNYQNYGVRLELIEKLKDVCIKDSLQTDGGEIANPDIAKKYGLASALIQPIVLGKSLKYHLIFFSSDKSKFSKKSRETEKLKERCQRIAEFAAVAINHFESQNSYNQLTHRQELLNDAIKEMVNVKSDDRDSEIFNILLKYSRLLYPAAEIEVLKLETKTKRLVSVKKFPPDSAKLDLDVDEGVCGKALKEGKPQIVRDKNDEKWMTTFVVCNPANVSEIAMPLMAENAPIRKGEEISPGIRKIGVLNLESTRKNAFTEDDEKILTTLTRQASLLLEKRANEIKFSQLQTIERQTYSQKDWKRILRVVANGIVSVLSFDLVNISLIDPEQNTINTEYIVGIAPERIDEFKNLSKYFLNRNNIQAEIYRKKIPEVIEEYDERLDSKIYETFNYKDYIQVFIPVISSLDNKCVGTIQAGYKSTGIYEDYIYESDIQILQKFAESVAEAYIKKRSKIQDIVIHEIRAPVSGILGHVNILQNLYTTMTWTEMNIKFEDIILDCDILRHNIEDLEFYLGRPAPRPLEIEYVQVMRDVVIKTITQLRAMVKANKFDTNKLIYQREDANKIGIYTDSKKISQVVYNLLLNSIRYAEIEKNEFQIKVLVDTDSDNNFYIIRFQDWGIGINREYSERIFEEHFRSPEAIAKTPNGTGLGLSIARKIMRDLNGDLILVRNHKPTEFQVKIPKRYRNKPVGFKG